MKEDFVSIFGNEPFEFQTEVAQHLVGGQSVVLRAPTGAGKTRAALFPFLYALRKRAIFPGQMIYSLPLRTLATSLYLDTLATCETAFPDLAQRPIIKIQTGERPEDPQFRTGDIVFATYDQSLSSFLTIPVGLSKREGNVNAGAVVSSYLVFDEFHLMEAGRSLATMVEMLKWLRPWTVFLLMTATLSETMTRRLGDYLDAKVVNISRSGLSCIPSQQNKRRLFTVHKELLTAEDVLRTHEHRSIAVCNTVDRAQQLFVEIEAKLAESCRFSGHAICLLHSRFLPGDRKLVERNILDWFGRDVSLRQNAILVATQAIEVGLDLTCEHLHTEIAPAAAIVQRAGRCARFPGEAGTVHVYDVQSGDGGEKMYLPYDSKGDIPLCPSTWAALQCRGVNGNTVDYRREQALIRLVYNKPDRHLLTDSTLRSRRSEIAGPNGVFITNDRAKYADLVRLVDSRSFFVHCDPDSVDSPMEMQTFSISPGTLVRHWKLFDRSNIDQDRWFARLVAVKQSGDDEQSQRYAPLKYEYRPVFKVEQFYNEYFFVVNPKFVDYTARIGLRFLEDGRSLPADAKEDLSPLRYTTQYDLETYQEHIDRVLCAYLQIFKRRSRFQYFAKQLLVRHNISLEDLIRATIAGHDIGKLADGWQAWVQVWQRDYKQRAADEGGFYAHTDYDSSRDIQAQMRLNKLLPRPTHAAEGAQAIYDVFAEMFPEEFARAAYTAIVRHHNPNTDSVHDFRIGVAGQKEAARVFGRITGCPWPEPWSGLLSGGSQCLMKEKPLIEQPIAPEGTSNDAFLVYLVLARALRISDQQSFSFRDGTHR